MVSLNGVKVPKLEPSNAVPFPVEQARPVKEKIMGERSEPRIVSDRIPDKISGTAFGRLDRMSEEDKQKLQ